MTVRFGLGFDSHRLRPGRRLVLGGIEIPFELGLDGHSDADALVHAVIDALLGAAGRGSIGERFPDDDPAYQGADSCRLLAGVWDELARAGYSVVNVDCVVLAERPRLGPYLGAMKARLASILSVEAAAVSVKAKTGEGLGFVGRGEGVAVMAVAALTTPPSSLPGASR